ncbi:MAG: imidazole glycerol phosphate synthase subunit HisH [Endomicrobium sp.]|jgi:glutamine amidotransferase|nr:imidazole glycerol phosphate synthase subunit HisH [Endomicrobium sp.]
MKKIAIIDYGFGNIKSVLNALHYLNVQAFVINNCTSEILNFDGLILPGVGAFKPAIDFLHDQGFDKAILDYVNCGKMLYGICLGFQLLFDISYENGKHQGLGLIHGEVRQFIQKDNFLKVPHMGWNNISIINQNLYTRSMFNNILNEESFYFVHSYYAVPYNVSQVSSVCTFGIQFCSSISYKNIWGSQFHPEKSGEKGLQILRNFIDEVNINK